MVRKVNSARIVANMSISNRLPLNMTNGVFIFLEPQPDDNRPRNAYGVLIGFGQAYAAFYAAQDKRNDLMVSDDDSHQNNSGSSIDVSIRKETKHGT